MKNLLTILFVVFISIPGMAREETLFNGDIESGWYGGPVFKVGQIYDNTGILLGGQGGWIINHRFVMGGKGYILVNPVEIENLQNILVGFGCGGAFFEYVIASNKLFHFSIESMIGAGGVYSDVKNYSEYHDPVEYTGDACFVLEPGINLILNVTKNIRVGAGVNYRYVDGIDYDAGLRRQNADKVGFKNISDSDLNGVSAQIVLKIGVF